MRLPRGRTPTWPSLSVYLRRPSRLGAVLIWFGAGGVLGSRLFFSFNKSRVGSFALPISRASVGPSEGGEPPGDTPILVHLGGPPQPFNCGGKRHSRRLTGRILERGTHATQPNNAGNFSYTTLNATHGTSPVRQRTTVTRTGECPTPAQHDLPNQPDHATRTRLELAEEKGPTRVKTEQDGPINLFFTTCSLCVLTWNPIYPPVCVSDMAQRPHKMAFQDN